MRKKNELYEKLRDELFEYRVSIKTYLKNIKTIIISGTVIISLLAFFGYNKIENIENLVFKEVNERLKVTDDLLSKIDQKKIDSLNIVLTKKEKEFNQTIKNFDLIIKTNKSLEDKLLRSIDENSRTKEINESYYEESQTDYFEIRPFSKTIKLKEKIDFYLIFKENVDLTNIDNLCLKLFPKNTNIQLQDKYYKVNSNFNKLSLRIDSKYKNHQEYQLKIGFYRKEGENIKFYNSEFDVKLN